MSTQKKKSWPQIGSLRKSDEGNLYLSFKLAAPLEIKALVYRKGGEVVENITLHPNDKGYVTMLLQDPEKEIDSLVKKEFITETEGERRKSTIPVNLKYNIVAKVD